MNTFDLTFEADPIAEQAELSEIQIAAHIGSAPTIKADGPSLLEQALMHLGKSCDGAQNLDGVGFNAKDHAFFAVHVATARAGGTVALSYRRKIVDRLLKYGSQLFVAGINVNDLASQEAELAQITAREQTSGDRKLSQADQLLDLAAGWELTHWEGQPYATALLPLPDGSFRKETRRFARDGARQLLIQAYFTEQGRAPSTEALQQALQTLEARASLEGKEERVFIRTASHEGRVYYDLVNDAGEAVEVSATGWRTTQDAPVKFLRPKGMRPQVTPVKGGEIEELRPFLNLDGAEEGSAESAWILLVAYCYFSLFPDCPHPILLLQGEQGSGKSFLCRLLRKLCDPHSLPIRTAPKDAEALGVGAKNSWILAFDNLVDIPGWFSDGLCQISTGGGFAAREKFTDAEESIVTFLRPVILNGIAGQHGRADLGDRILKVNLGNAIADTDRAPETEMYERFEQMRPRILGAFFTALAGGLRKKGTVKPARLPRMADFALAVLEAEEFLPWKQGRFLEAFDSHRQEQIEAQISADPLASAICTYVGLFGPAEGTVSDWLERLEKHTTSKGKDWPSAHNLSAKLTYLAGSLRKVGIGVERRTGHGKKRLIKLVQLEQKVADLPPVPPPDGEPIRERSFTGGSLLAELPPELPPTPPELPPSASGLSGSASSASQLPPVKASNGLRSLDTGGSGGGLAGHSSGKGGGANFSGWTEGEL